MPSSKGYKRDYKQEYANDSTKRKKDRAQRNKARRIMMAKGVVKKGDGKDVGHKRAMSKGGKTTASNLMVQTAASNRSFSRTKSGSMKSETSRKERRRGRS